MNFTVKRVRRELSPVCEYLAAICWLSEGHRLARLYRYTSTYTSKTKKKKGEETSNEADQGARKDRPTDSTGKGKEKSWRIGKRRRDNGVHDEGGRKGG